LGGDAKIEANRLGVSDVEVSIRFGGKSGSHTALEPIGSQVFIDHFPDKIRGEGWIRFGHLFVSFLGLKPESSLILQQNPIFSIIFNLR
jgi:hypothetical protein